MNRTVLSETLQRAVNFLAQQTGGSRSEIITRLADSVDAARSTVRQDVHGYIKKPSIKRLESYSSVLGFTLTDLVQMAREDEIVYDEPWIGLKGRESARSAGDIRYDETSDSGEWDKPSWSDWKSALDLEEDATWDSVSADVRSRVASTTVFGEAGADGFTDANFYPLVDPPSTLVFGALDSAWRLAGKAPDPDGLRSTLESLANSAFDESFREDESAIYPTGGKADPGDISVGDKVGWKTSSDSINTYGTIRRVQTSGTASPDDADYSLDASEDDPVFWTEVYDVEEGEHTGQETIHRASELTPMDSFPEKSKSSHEGVDLSLPSKIKNAADAFLDAKEEDFVPDSCGTGTGTDRANKISSDDLTWKDFLTRENGTPIPAYLNSHEEDVSAEGPPTEWSEEEWSDCGNAQMAAWGFYADWFKQKANELARARDEDEPYTTSIFANHETEVTPLMAIKSATPEGKTVEPFIDKVDEDDTEFKGSRHAEVKDVDRSSNIVEVYYAAWSEDAHDERFTQGAFEKSIKQFGPQSDKQRIVHLNQHMTMEPIGVPLEMREDDHGLFSRTRISETRLGEDVLTLYDDGVITEHSVGFKRKQTEQQEDGPDLIHEALLLEGSNVTWGANSDTPFMGFKSAEEAIPALADRLKSLRRALRDGLTDEVAKSVEMSIGHVESQLRTLLDSSASAFEKSEETNADPVKDEPLDKAVDAFEEQFQILDETTSEKRQGQNGNDDESGGIVTPDFDFDDQKEEDIVIPDEMTLFGGTNG